MLKGVVISSDVSAYGNRVFHSGDEVTEHNFGEQRFRQLVSEGHIRCEQIKPEPERLPELPIKKESQPVQFDSDNGLSDLLNGSAFGNGKKKKNRT